MTPPPPSRAALLPAALLLALGGCSLLRGPAPQRPQLPDTDTPAQRACLQEARNSASVRDLERERNAQNTSNWERLAEEASVRTNRAYRDCLRREGLALPGGVEALRAR